MQLTIVSGSVSAIQTEWDFVFGRQVTWFRIDNRPARMSRAGSFLAPRPAPVAERDQVTACGLRKRDFILVFALYNHTTGVMGRSPVGVRIAGCALIVLMGVFLVIQDSNAVKSLGLVILAAAGFTAWRIRRITGAARLIRRHIQPPE
ncbi:MAG: hypothetical protein OXU19_04250 [bacterium]|nr:hypothetical protein [bacterium]MDE0242367.1 hypothetical protein [bacterium]MDE0418590.1 hypothetical protein [bacterium]